MKQNLDRLLLKIAEARKTLKKENIGKKCHKENKWDTAELKKSKPIDTYDTTYRTKARRLTKLDKRRTEEVKVGGLRKSTVKARLGRARNITVRDVLGLLQYRLLSGAN